jgi:putative ubiquitin-RnfH superfamily antitoxin RatB of RatAB toxin-antitoxin module
MGNGPGKLLHVEVAYALPGAQVLLALDVPAGTTVQGAIERSGILGRFPGLQVKAGQIGIFGRPAKLDARVRDGDRVEIYRPLIADPRDARRARVKKPGKTARR